MIKRNEQFLTLGMIYAAIRTRFVTVVVLTALLCVIGLVVLLSLRDIYASEGEFYLNAGRGTITIDPTAQTSQVANLMDTRQSEIQSIKDMLTGRMMLEQTVRRVGIDRILEQRSWVDLQKELVMTQIDDFLGVVDTLEDGLTAEQTAELTRVQEAVEYVADRISVLGDKEGNTVQIRAKAHTSLLAHDIVDSLMNEFKDHYVEVHRTVGSQDFFEQEYMQAVKRVEKADSELAQYKNQMKALSIESKADLIRQESAGIQAEMLRSEADFVSTNASIQQLDQMIAVEPEMKQMTETARSSTASDSMRQELYRQEIAESELASRYSDDHPALLKARAALKVARTAYEGQDSLFGEKSEAANPIRENLLLERLKANAQRDGLEAKIASLKLKVIANEAKMLQLNSDEIKVAELTRAVDLTRDELREYGKKREEARRQTSMDQDLISALSVSQPATHMIKKVGPQRLLGLVIIGFGSLMFSCALAVYRQSNINSNEIAEMPFYRGRLQHTGLHETLEAATANGEYTVMTGRADRTIDDLLGLSKKRVSQDVNVSVSEIVRG